MIGFHKIRRVSVNTFHPGDSRRPASYLCVLLAVGFVASARAAEESRPSPAQPGGANWERLFDGESFAGWKALGRQDIPGDVWRIEDGSIRRVRADGKTDGGQASPDRVDLITADTFADFELRLQWKITRGGNSGIKYNVSEQMSLSNGSPHAALGFEYQILDDDLHPDGRNGAHRTSAALYDLIAPKGHKLLPVGEFNETRIVFRDNHGEHWLNGVRVLQFELGSTEMESLLAASKYRSISDFAQRRRGHIVLQDHGDEVWFRNIRLRRIGAP